jgi:hypothetical protein
LKEKEKHYMLKHTGKIQFYRAFMMMNYIVNHMSFPLFLWGGGKGALSIVNLQLNYNVLEAGSTSIYRCGK